MTLFAQKDMRIERVEQQVKKPFTVKISSLRKKKKPVCDFKFEMKRRQTAKKLQMETIVYKRSGILWNMESAPQALKR